MSLFLQSCAFVLILLALLGAWREYLNTELKKSEHLMRVKLSEIQADKEKLIVEMRAAQGALQVHRESGNETKH